jgi:hypothetical protein
MTVRLSPLAGAGWQLFDDSGIPLAGGKIYTYTAGSSTPQATYTTSAGNIAHSNPIVLDANGRVPNEVWLTQGIDYKFIIKTSAEVLIGTYDNLQGINDIQAQITAIEAGIFADLADTSNVAKGDALIGFKQANMAGVYTGAVGQTVHRKLQEIVSVFDFMTTVQIQDVQARTSLVDVQSAINAAFAAVIANGSGTLYFPRGTYYVSGYIGNTDYAGVTQEINLAVIGEPGTVINCNPSVYENTAIYLRFQNAKTLIVKNIQLECNDKVASGIVATSVAYANFMQVDNCIVNNCKAVNNAGVTTAVQPISISTTAFSFIGSVTNCVINNVTRAKTGLACQALVAVGFETTLIENNSIETVKHSGIAGDKVDADGIVVFSNQDGLGNYQKSTVTISNNTIRGCEGRFVKLQTNGSAVVENNLCELIGSYELIDNWRGFDSQVGDATITKNTVRIGPGYTGGTSGTMFSIQPPLLANQDYANEGFFQRVTSNNIEVRGAQLPYFCIPSMPDAGVTANLYVDISNNLCNTPAVLDTADQSKVAFGDFIYQSSGPSVANTNGQVIWNIRGNIVSTYNFIRLAYTQADYTGKWWFYIADNWKTPTGYSREIFYAGATAPYTSTIMVRDNMIGEYAGNFTMPSNPTYWLEGCDIALGDTSAGVISPAPANYRNGRFYKKGNILGVEVVYSGAGYHYISMDNGANWYTP